MSEPIGRRDFLGRLIATGVAGRLALDATAADAPQSRPAKKPAHDETVRLGRTDVRPTRLGLGTGMKGWNHQSNQTRMGQEKFTALIGHAYDQGIRYFDLADMYGSHEYFKRAMQALKLPREKLTIVTKTVSREAEVVRKDVERFRQEIGTDYVDLVLLHCLTDKDMPWSDKLKGPMDVLSEAKQKGHIRAHGCSCHSLAAVKMAATTPWVDADLARFNPWGERMDAPPAEVEPVLRQFHERRAGLLCMKILGEGTKTKPEHQEESLRFVLSRPFVDAIIIGFEKPAEIDEIIRRWKAVIA